VWVGRECRLRISKLGKERKVMTTFLSETTSRNSEHEFLEDLEAIVTLRHYCFCTVPIAI
jgi:hypothetical protein